MRVAAAARVPLRRDENVIAHRVETTAAERARIGRTLHERVAANHSVDTWARRLLEVVER